MLLGGGLVIPLLEAHLPDGFIDSLMELFGFVPVGFLLGLLCGFIAFGVFKLLALFRQLAR